MPGHVQMDIRKDSATPPPDRDVPPKMPRWLCDPVLHRTYVVGEYLGKGGFAWCYEAIDQLQNVYALKVIPKFRLTKPHHRSKVLHEIQIHEPLRHEHIVRMYSSFEDNDNMYMVLEYCQLKSLVNIIRNRHVLTEPEAREYLRHMLLAVHHLQTVEGVLHRDLKLGNMLVTSDMRVKLADFGLATYMNEEHHSVSICGTPNYISPEVLNKLGHSVETESWALGCILYAMLCGRPPFETNLLEETYRNVRAGKYSLPPNLSHNASDLIRSLLHPVARCRPTPKQALIHPFMVNAPEICRLNPEHCYRMPRTNEFELAWRETDAYKRALGAKNELLDPRPTTPSSSRSTPPSRGSSTSSSGTDSGLGQGCQIKSKTVVSNSSLLDVLRWFHNMLSMEKRGRSVAPHMREFSMGPVPFTENRNVLYVTKWIDYTNKYGFGCQLSDGTVSVAFLDKSVMSFSKQGSIYQYTGHSGRQPFLWLREEDTPPELREKVQLMKMFVQYMDQNLIQGGDIRGGRSAAHPAGLPSLVHWKRRDHLMLMVLSDATFQVNNFQTHTKLVLSNCGSEGPSVYVTFIDQNRHAQSMLLSHRSSMARLHLSVTDGCYDLLDAAAQAIKTELRALTLPSPNPGVWVTDC